MESNLEETLTLESAMGTMEFDHSDVVVNQEDITLEETGQVEDMEMELGNIEEQNSLIGQSEEAIVSDFMNDDQFSFQEYTIQSENTGAEVKVDQNQIGNIMSQEENVNDSIEKFGNITNELPTSNSNVIVMKRAIKKTSAPSVRQIASPYPRQVAIAPKPTSTQNVQYSIGSKPMTLVMNKPTGGKVSVANLIQGGVKGNAVLAQIGKQLVMVPASASGQKIKLVPSSGTGENIQIAHLVANKKPVITKLIMQGQASTDNSSSPAVITKLLPMNTNQARYVMQQKTVPISIGGTKTKVVITSPKKQNLGVNKKQIIAIKQTPKVVAVTQGNTSTKRVVITNPNQNVIIRPVAPKPTQMTTGPRTQLHPINVPGKGIQYIKLVTNQTTKPSPKPQVPVAVSTKNFVFTDSKGNIIQVSGEKVDTSESQPFMVEAASTPATEATKPKVQKKLVRIAPMSTKTQSMPTVRSSQSLLAPITQPSVNLSETSVSLEEFNEMVEQNNLKNYSQEVEYPQDNNETQEAEKTQVEEQTEYKPTLQSLIRQTVEEEFEDNVESEYKIELKPSVDNASFMIDNSKTNMEFDRHNAKNISKTDESPIIIVPASTNYSDTSKEQNESMYSEDGAHLDKNITMSVDAEVVPYISPTTPPAYNETDIVSSELGLRPRKACNCAKSQCLKLYCDCFANGEFCNQCNCNNCNNNLENEELRQKAIRTCLERNPNAFRPKIGKSKALGPEIIRRHNKGCNCKRSGCLKNYCECYEAKIACTAMCKCFGCRNVEETLERRRDAVRLREKLADSSFRPPTLGQVKQPCSFMTSEVIEAVCQCLLAAAVENEDDKKDSEIDSVQDVIEEFARCLQDIIGASHQGL